MTKKLKSVLVGLPLLLVLVGFMARNTLAESIMRARLDARGFRCAELALELDVALQQVRMVELRCTSQGAIAELSLPQPAVIDFEGLTPSHMDLPAVQLTLSTESRPADEGSSLLARMNIRRRILPLLRALRAPALRALPPLNVERLALRRGDHELALEGITLLSTETGERISVTHIRFDREHALVAPEILDAVAEVGRNDEPANDAVTLRGQLRTSFGPVHRSWTFFVSARVSDEELADIHYEFTSI